MEIVHPYYLVLSSPTRVVIEARVVITTVLLNKLLLDRSSLFCGL